MNSNELSPLLNPEPALLDVTDNTLDFADAKSCAKWGCGPLWKPREIALRSLTRQHKAAGFSWLMCSLRAIQKPPSVLTPVRTFGGFCGNEGCGLDEK